MPGALRPTSLHCDPLTAMQGWRFEEAFDLLLGIGRIGSRVPFKTGEELLSYSCLPFRVPDGSEDDQCSLGQVNCVSLVSARQGKRAGGGERSSC